MSSTACQAVKSVTLLKDNMSYLASATFCQFLTLFCQATADCWYIHIPPQGFRAEYGVSDMTFWIKLLFHSVLRSFMPTMQVDKNSTTPLNRLAMLYNSRYSGGWGHPHRTSSCPQEDTSVNSHRVVNYNKN